LGRGGFPPAPPRGKGGPRLGGPGCLRAAGAGGRRSRPVKASFTLTPSPYPARLSRSAPPRPLLPLLAEYAFLSSLNVLNVMQSAIMFFGISGGMLLCTAGVARVGRRGARRGQEGGSPSAAARARPRNAAAAAAAAACIAPAPPEHPLLPPLAPTHPPPHPSPHPPPHRPPRPTPQGTLTVGDTVLFLTLMAQLYGPLNFFGEPLARSRPR
jgi:hypothetical protein